MPDSSGCTPLFYAAGYGSDDIMKRLINAGANPFAQRMGLRSPIDEFAVKQPEKYKKDSFGVRILAEKAMAKRLKKEDKSRTAATGYEFDI